MERILRDIMTLTLKDMGIDDTTIDIEVPRDEGYGDLSTPIAMRLAKKLKKPPKASALDLISKLKTYQDDLFDNIEIAGNGFINFRLSKTALTKELLKIITNDDYFKEDIGKGKKVQIEFVSANPTGPLHLGHGRGAAVGMALSNILTEAGYDVQKEYYINDAGRQISLLGESVFARYRQNVCNDIDYPFPEDGYKGDYIIEIAKTDEVKRLLDGCNNLTPQIHETLNRLSCEMMLNDIKKDLSDFGISFDNWQSEKMLYEKGMVQNAIQHLSQKGYIYEKDGARWFKSTAFGDDKDRVVIKQDGEYTYFASDIAYHKLKLDKGYEEIVDIWGADHHGYINRVSAVLQALGLKSEAFKVLLIQMVTLLRGGKPVSMSKRSGDFITLREVMDEITPDTTKFLFLTRRHDTPLEIDIEKAKMQSSENPVYYVQYVHARICSIFEKASSTGINLDTSSDVISYNYTDDEMRLIKKVLFYPMTLRGAVLSREPHRIAFYLQELAGLFHPYYHTERVITDDKDTTHARLILCEAIKKTVSHGLKMLGVSAPQKM
ncbi:MAG: arginine--tRNA ligase [Thermodesulfovibrionales bacterium]|nr:arginine--tRNA ligase [Thermodesulfovibrionales bacterium]